LGERDRRSGAAVLDGARSERARIVRLLHDTVLQSLEAMGLGSGVDLIDPAAALAEVRAAARAEAARLRLALHASPESTGLDTGLGEVVDEATTRGLRVRLVAAECGRWGIQAPRREALCGATREALSNVLRHSGAAAAVVRVDVVSRGVQVVVRDHGRGFVAEDGRFGFGIRESILGRMREVGGRAGVQAAPCAGTRVTMWVPA
jgi:signal transduction histidine kinase